MPVALILFARLIKVAWLGWVGEAIYCGTSRPFVIPHCPTEASAKV